MYAQVCVVLFSICAWLPGKANAHLVASRCLCRLLPVRPCSILQLRAIQLLVRLALLLLLLLWLLLWLCLLMHLRLLVERCLAAWVIAIVILLRGHSILIVAASWWL